MIASAAKWYGASHILKHLIVWITLLLYAKYLQPEQYGTLIILSIVNGVILLVKDFGLGAALIKSDRDDNLYYSSLYWLNLTISFFCFILLFLSADLSRLLYKNDELSELIQIVSINFLILGVSGLKISSLEKNFKFKTIAAIEIISVVLASLIGVYFAIKGYESWAYVIHVVIQSAVLMLLLVFYSGRDLILHFDWSDIKGIRKFSGNLMGYSIFNYSMRNMDSIIIGGVLGEAALGLYSLAFRIVLYPIQTISVISQRVLFPIFSRIKDERKFKRLYIKITILLSVLLFPLYVLLYFVGPELIAFGFGSEWVGSIQLLNILIPIGLLQVIVAPVGVIYQAKGRTDLLFRWGVISSVATLLMLMISINWGIAGVAIGFLLVTLLLFVPALMIPFSLMGSKISELFIALWKPIGIVIFSFVFSVVLSMFIDTGNYVFSIMITPVVFVGVCLAMMCVYEKSLVKEILQTLGVIK